MHSMAPLFLNKRKNQTSPDWNVSSLNEGNICVDLVSRYLFSPQNMDNNSERLWKPREGAICRSYCYPPLLTPVSILSILLIPDHNWALLPSIYSGMYKTDLIAQDSHFIFLDEKLFISGCSSSTNYAPVLVSKVRKDSPAFPTLARVFQVWGRKLEPILWSTLFFVKNVGSD